MAHPQVVSAKPYAGTRQGGRPTRVTVIAPTGTATNSRRRSTAPTRASRWIAEVVMVLTSGFAVLDIYLLLTSLHH